MVTSPGERFARALAAQDGAAMGALLADAVVFQALTPGRVWQASTRTEVVEDIILGRWLGGAKVEELCSVKAGLVSGRGHVAYRLRVNRSGGGYLIEQQAYYSTEGGLITWMQVLCSGYQAVG